jgi:chitin synthase
LKTIDSLSNLRYDDKRKLLFIICDGMIVGSGNDGPTRIVLDILSHNTNRDPEPLSFISLGEGAKQHNMGKVYLGLYEVNGHVVPHIVVTKCGKPSEKARRGILVIVIPRCCSCIS